jgi:hypothetical protein
MSRSGITIDATVLAPAIRVNARLESDVRAVVVCDDGLSEIAIVDRLPSRSLGIVLVLRIRLEMERLEAVAGIKRSAAAVVHARHVSRSSERIGCLAGNAVA